MKYRLKISMGLAVTLGLAVVVISGFWWAAHSAQGWKCVLWAGARAGLIGSLVDWMALVMVFQQKWWLPFSGVIPRHKDELMEQIAEAVEKEWLTPDALRNYLKGVSLVEPMTLALNALLNEPRNRKDLGETAAQWADGRLSDTQTCFFLEEIIGGMLPRAVDGLPLPMRLLGRGALGLGLTDALEIPARLSRSVIREAREQLEAHRQDGSLEEMLINEINRVLPMVLSTQAEEGLKEGFFQFFCEHVQPGQVVRQHLSALTAEDIRIMVEDKARKHLEWIRVNGAIGGFLLGLLFEVLARMGGRIG